MNTEIQQNTLPADVARCANHNRSIRMNCKRYLSRQMVFFEHQPMNMHDFKPNKAQCEGLILIDEILNVNQWEQIKRCSN